MGKNPQAIPPRQVLMESMVKTNLITVDLANYHIGRMSDKEVLDEIELRRKLGLLDGIRD